MSKELQVKILSGLEEHYPGRVPGDNIVNALSEFDRKSVIKELAHLKEYDLIKAAMAVSPDGSNKVTLGNVSITAKGRDYLEPDGGLAAELGIVTVRLHAQTIKDIINAKIESLDTDQSQKSRMKEALQNMPAQALQDVVTGLVQKGLESGPAAMAWLQRVLGG